MGRIVKALDLSFVFFCKTKKKDSKFDSWAYECLLKLYLRAGFFARP